MADEKTKETAVVKELPKKVVKSNLVKFLVRIPFNGHKRGSILNGVERKKANIWVSKNRGSIVE